MCHSGQAYRGHRPSQSRTYRTRPRPAPENERGPWRRRTHPERPVAPERRWREVKVRGPETKTVFSLECSLYQPTWWKLRSLHRAESVFNIPIILLNRCTDSKLHTEKCQEKPTAAPASRRRLLARTAQGKAACPFCAGASKMTALTPDILNDYV